MIYKVTGCMKCVNKEHYSLCLSVQELEADQLTWQKKGLKQDGRQPFVQELADVKTPWQVTLWKLGTCIG